MRLRMAALAAATVLAIACGAENPLAPEETPAWLSGFIRQIQSEPIANPPVVINSYTYAGQTVYYVPPRFPDGLSDLFATNGSLLCHPDGGFTGRGDGKCPDFHSAKQSGKTIWRDTRAGS